MPLNRLPVAGSRTRVARVDPNATDGAVLGVNLYDQDGAIVDLAALIAEALTGVSSGGTTIIEGGAGPSTTDDLQEGRYNLYFTDVRADARIAAHDTVPCFLTDGTQSNLFLTSDLKVPCFLSDGTESDLATAA